MSRRKPSPAKAAKISEKAFQKYAAELAFRFSFNKAVEHDRRMPTRHFAPMGADFARCGARVDDRRNGTYARTTDEDAVTCEACRWR